MLPKKPSRFLSILSLIALLPLSACVDDKLVLTGERQSIDIASIDDVRATDSRIVGGGYRLTRPVSNREWLSSSGGYRRNPPHAKGGTQGKIVFHIKVGAGTGYATTYPVKLRDRSAPISPRGKANVVNIAPIVADNKIFTIDSRYQISAFDWKKSSDIPKLKWSYILTDANNYAYANGGGMAFTKRGGKNGKTPLLLLTTGYGRVVAFDANNGDIIFETNLITPIKNAAAISGRIAIVKTIDGGIYALSLKNGRKIWQNSGFISDAGSVDAIGFKAGSAPTVAAGRIWVGYISGNVAALNASSGSVLWQNGAMKFTVGDDTRYREIIGNMVLDGGVIYAFTFGGDAAAFRASNGARLWRKKLATTENPTIDNQTIFIIDADYNLKSINKSSGNLFWNRILDKYLYPGTRSLSLIEWHGPLLVSRQLFLTSSVGKYAFVNALNGNMIAKGQSDIYASDSPPIAAKNTILFVNKKGYLVGIQ